MTIGDFLPLYEQNHVINLKNWRGTSRRLHRYVALLGSLQLGDLKRLQVIQWHQEIGRTRGHTAANQALQQLHSLYAKAIEWEVYNGNNPSDRVKKFPKHSRTRFVQPAEMAWLLKALAEEMPQVETFFLTLLLTGSRLSEARMMRWADLDLERALWHKPMTKNNTAHTVPVPHALVERLQSLPRLTEWVFPSTPNGKNGFQPGCWSICPVEKAWGRIRRRAGLVDVTIHDLRRSCASWLAISGENLPVIQQVLNHRSLTSTQVYARLSVAPVRDALNKQAARMLEPAQPPRERQNEEWPG